MIVQFLFILMVSVVSIDAQVAKKPLLEIFTSKDCGFCSEAEPIIDSVLRDNPGEYSLLRYSVNTDPYKTPECVTRMNFYPGAYATPGLYINADRNYNNDRGGAKSFNQPMFEHYQQETTFLEMSLDASISGDIVTISAELNPLANYPEGLILHLAVVENQITMGRAKTAYHNRLMKMAPGAQGTNLPALTAQANYNFQEVVDMSSTMNETNHDLQLVAFVQNKDTKEIIQSEMIPISHSLNVGDLSLEVKDSINNPLSKAYFELKSLDDNSAYITRWSLDEGEIYIPNILEGRYEYSVSKPSYITQVDTIEISSQDIHQEIVLSKPNAYLYEDFEYGQDDYEDLPNGWTELLSNSQDQTYVIMGMLNLYKGSQGSSQVAVATPELDFDLTDKLSIEAGYAMGSSTVTIYSSSQPQLSPLNLVQEIQVGISFETFVVDLTQVPEGDKYLVFHMESQDWGTTIAIESITLHSNGQGPALDILETMPHQNQFFSWNNDSRTIHFHEPGEFQLKVVTPLGQMVEFSESYMHRFNLEHLQPGIYFLKLKSENQSHHLKIHIR